MTRQQAAETLNNWDCSTVYYEGNAKEHEAAKMGAEALLKFDTVETSLRELNKRLGEISRIVNARILKDEKAYDFWEKIGPSPTIPDGFAYKIRAALNGGVQNPPEEP